jgi:hypothetical protein
LSPCSAWPRCASFLRRWRRRWPTSCIAGWKVGDTARKSYSGFKAVADLLNRLNAEESKKILESIEDGQPELALEHSQSHVHVRRSCDCSCCFTIREIVSGVDKRQLALALRGANDDLRAQIFKAMSSRAVEMLKEDMEVLGPVRSREVAQAQQEILNLGAAPRDGGQSSFETRDRRRDAGVRSRCGEESFAGLFADSESGIRDCLRGACARSGP